MRNASVHRRLHVTRAKRNAENHYLGSAMIPCHIGKAFAEALAASD